MAAAPLQQLIETYRRVTGVDGAALSLGGKPIAASDPVSGALQDWQYVCGEGPSMDAYRLNRIVEVCDPMIEHERWMWLADVLGTWPFATIVSVPVTIGPSSVGALTLCHTRACGLSRSARRFARACAEHAADSAAGWLGGPLDRSGSTFDLGQFDRINCAAGVL